MITIIHGDDTTSSRDVFFSEKSKTENPIVFDGNDFELTLFLQTLGGKSLFAENKIIFMDGIFSGKKSSKTAEKIISAIQKSHSPIDFIIWEGSEFPKTFLNQFPKANIKLFKLPQSLFSFLDSIRPGSPQNITLFHSALRNSDENFLFTMLVRQFRLLLDLKNGNSIDETLRLQTWQKDKLQRQSKLFTQEELLRIYKNLYKIDLETKTGAQPNLTAAIDFFLLDI